MVASMQMIKEAAVDIVARAIYETMPETDGREFVDGFQVSPSTTLTWRQLLECGDHAVEPYRKAALAAIEAIRDMQD